MGNRFYKLVFKTTGLILILVVAIFAVTQIVHNRMKQDEFIHDENIPTAPIQTDKLGPSTEEIKKPQHVEPQMVENKTIVLMGTDKGELRTDTICVLMLNRTQNTIDIVSIPRDTKVVWDLEQRAIMRDKRGYSIYTSKINEMLVYGGVENIYGLTLSKIEQLLELKVDNYVLVELDIFKEFIDAIGGVTVDVKQRMYYTDKAQGLYIDLKQGVQVLNGEQAEMFVRFRKYPQGDIERVAAQQQFLKALIEQVKKPSILLKIPKLVQIMSDSVRTDFGLSDIGEYISYLDTIALDNIKFHTLPGEGKYEGGVSYFILNQQEYPAFLDNLKGATPLS